MLCLSRELGPASRLDKRNQIILKWGDEIVRIYVQENRRTSIRIGVDAPKEVQVIRGELEDKWQDDYQGDGNSETPDGAKTDGRTPRILVDSPGTERR